MLDVAGQVETGNARHAPPATKNAALVSSVCGEAAGEFGADLVGGLGDARADPGADARRAGAERGHPRDGRFEHPGRARRASRHARRRSPRPRNRRTAPARNRPPARRGRCRAAVVTMPSARGDSLAPPGFVDGDDAWRCGPDSRSPGDPSARPSRPAAMARLRATLSGSSPEPKPQLSEANMPSLTPPRRVKKAWRIAGPPDRGHRG